MRGDAPHAVLEGWLFAHVFRLIDVGAQSRRDAFVEVKPVWEQPDGYQFTDVLYLAGEQVPAGTYRQIGTQRKIELDRDDRLPASLDGRVACYVRIDNEWRQMQSQ